MEQIPWFLRFAAANWISIRAQLDLWAQDNGYVPYSQEPKRYQLHGWGLLGFPPRIACNVIYHDGDVKIFAAQRFS
jgi:hypothetical protein